MGFDANMGGMQSGAANNMFPLNNSYNTGPGPQGGNQQQQPGNLAQQYGWGPAGFGWGGMFGAPSWQGFNQTSVPPGLGGGQPGQGQPGMNPGLMGGASSGWPWMQFMPPFWQYMQAGGVGGQQPGTTQPPGSASTPAPAAPPTASSPHFSMQTGPGTAVAAGQQSPQYDMRSQMNQAFNQFIRPTAQYKHNVGLQHGAPGVTWNMPGGVG